MGPVRVVFAVLLAGCYAPTASPGAPCNPAGECPDGLVCVADVCQRGPVDDASIDMALVDGEPSPDGSNPASDAAADAMVDAPPPGPLWGPPVLLGIQGTDPSVSSNRLSIAFMRTVGGDDRIFLGTRADLTSPFQVSELAAVSSPAEDKSPELVTGGMYFTSARDGGADVYFALNIGNSWFPPTVVTELSSPMLDDTDVAVSPDGRTAIVVRVSASRYTFWLSSRASTSDNWTAPIRVPDFEIGGDIAGPTLTNNATTVYFHAGSNRDLYVARRVGTGTSFTTPVPVTELNTTAREAAPFVNADETLLMFERAGGLAESARL